VRHFFVLVPPMEDGSPLGHKKRERQAAGRLDCIFTPSTGGRRPSVVSASASLAWDGMGMEFGVFIWAWMGRGGRSRRSRRRGGNIIDGLSPWREVYLSKYVPCC
jgi:hypothetical protein